jgi:hypothetical protein
MLTDCPTDKFLICTSDVRNFLIHFLSRLLTHFRSSGNTDVTPVGAVNAGLLTSSALTARQASVPLLAIAGLVSVLGLL